MGVLLSIPMLSLVVIFLVGVPLVVTAAGLLYFAVRPTFTAPVFPPPSATRFGVSPARGGCCCCLEGDEDNDEGEEGPCCCFSPVFSLPPKDVIAWAAMRSLFKPASAAPAAAATREDAEPLLLSGVCCFWSKEDFGAILSLWFSLVPGLVPSELEASEGILAISPSASIRVLLLLLLCFSSGVVPCFKKVRLWAAIQGSPVLVVLPLPPLLRGGVLCNWCCFSGW